MFEAHLIPLASRFWPNFQTLEARERKHQLSELITIAAYVPWAIIGLVWLMRVTDPNIFIAEWPILILVLVLAVLFGILPFFQIFSRRLRAYSSLQPTVITSAVLLFGPSVLWIDVLNTLLESWIMWRRSFSGNQRLTTIRNLVFQLISSSLMWLVSLQVYNALGGIHPFPGLTPSAVAPALGLMLSMAALHMLLLGGFFMLTRLAGLSTISTTQMVGVVAFVTLALFLPATFGILAAALYTQLGLATYLFLMVGVGCASLLAHHLSKAIERSRRRAQELSFLEQLGRALVAAPPDASTLPQTIREHVSDMFHYEQFEIRLTSGQELLRLPEDMPAVSAALCTWLDAQPQPHTFTPGAILPWTNQSTATMVLVTPIKSGETGTLLGSISLSLTSTVDQPSALEPALAALAAHIASALHRADEYAQTLAFQRVRQELAFARDIQTSLLPRSLPEITGWQLAAMLRPARETSGDFYDVLQLPDGCLGLLIADVADKGTGAALFMAMTRTLLRTYAFGGELEPGAVLRAVNERILTDSHTSMFVTVFYGILDPNDGRLTYANAGHNPPFVLNESTRQVRCTLKATGIPLGIIDDARWDADSVTLAPGELLLLYTDGVTEAHDVHEDLFGEQRMLQTAQLTPSNNADDLLQHIVIAVDHFSGPAPQFDDITLMLLMRDNVAVPVQTY